MYLHSAVPDDVDVEGDANLAKSPPFAISRDHEAVTSSGGPEDVQASEEPAVSDAAVDVKPQEQTPPPPPVLVTDSGKPRFHEL